MNSQDEKFLNTFQLFLLILIIIMAVKTCSDNEGKEINIESCKPTGCSLDR